MVAEGPFPEETRRAIDGGGVPPHTERAIPGPKREHGFALFWLSPLPELLAPACACPPGRGGAGHGGCLGYGVRRNHAVIAGQCRAGTVFMKSAGSGGAALIGVLPLQRSSCTSLARLAASWSGRSGPAAPAPVLPAIRSGWPEPGQLVRTGALAG